MFRVHYLFTDFSSVHATFDDWDGVRDLLLNRLTCTEFENAVVEVHIGGAWCAVNAD